MDKYTFGLFVIVAVVIWAIGALYLAQKTKERRAQDRRRAERKFAFLCFFMVKSVTYWQSHSAQYERKLVLHVSKPGLTIALGEKKEELLTPLITFIVGECGGLWIMLPGQIPEAIEDTAVEETVGALLERWSNASFEDTHQLTRR